jgi:uncharacterized NAD-dependent epimerase/dehydratase family protein
VTPDPDDPVRRGRFAVLADGHLDFHFGKTAIGLIRYRPHDVVAVIDGDHAGATSEQILGAGGAIPIVGALKEALALDPASLVIGVAPRGGALPHAWRAVIIDAIDAGLDIISGLHEFLGDDAELSAVAAAKQVRLVDLRRPTGVLDIARMTARRAGSSVVTLVGSDCAVGKMSVGLDLVRALQDQGVDAGLVATGQTGILITGNGIPLDRIVGDFMSGAVEREVDDACNHYDIVVVEGQGSLLHPAYSGVTLALLHGSRPDAMILVMMPTRTEIDGYDIRLPSSRALIETYEQAAGWVQQAPVIGIAVNGHGLDDAGVTSAIADIEAETNLPATDTFRQGAGKLADVLSRFHAARQPIS